jgi:mannose-6-phosphate isomerase class I
VDEFQLAELVLKDVPVTLGANEPRIVLVAVGSAEVSAGGDTVRLARGRAGFVPAGEGAATIRGTGAAYVVSPGADLTHTSR